jgi:hypothetical protein
MPRRSPIVFWLLLAATAAIDLLATSALFENGVGGEQAFTLYLSLAYGQLGLLCVWSVADHDSMSTRWLAPVSAALLVSVVLTLSDVSNTNQFDLESLATISCIVSLHVGSSLVLLWFVIPSSWTSRCAKVVARRGQFSMFQLIILMTCVAVFLSILRASDELVGEWVNVATFCFANVALLCGTLAFFQTRWLLPLRIAACALLAIGISAIVYWAQCAFADSLNPWVFYLVQAVVIVLWLCTCFANDDTSSADPESMLPLGIA